MPAQEHHAIQYHSSITIVLCFTVFNMGMLNIMNKKTNISLSEIMFYSKKGARFAFINADWRNFQSTSALNESSENAILIDDYLGIIKEAGWQRTYIIQAPLSSERFNAGVVAVMQKKRILGVTSCYVIISFKK